jgi:hypothetical protein
MSEGKQLALRRPKSAGPAPWSALPTTRRLAPSDWQSKRAGHAGSCRLGPDATT